MFRLKDALTDDVWWIESDRNTPLYGGEPYERDIAEPLLSDALEDDLEPEEYADEMERRAEEDEMQRAYVELALGDNL